MKNRFLALDIFRGATVAVMILVNTPGNGRFVYQQLDHSPWQGCTLTDLVFPFFLFAVGNSIALSMRKLEHKSSQEFWTKVIKRTFLIFLIGFLLNTFPFITYNTAGKSTLIPWHDYRIFGVLQRIALCYGITAILSRYVRNIQLIIISTALLLGYWLLCYAMNPADPYSLQEWFGTSIDKHIFGASHLYWGEGVAFDPEDLFSLPAALAQCIFGLLAGKYLIVNGKTRKTTKTFLITGITLMILGYCWGSTFPIIKKIWTSSYAIYTTGIALIFLSLLNYWIEIKNRKQPFEIMFDSFGKNTLFIYVISEAIPKIIWLIRLPHTDPTDPKIKFLNVWDWLYRKMYAPLFINQKIDSFLMALSFILFLWIIAYTMDKRKIYIKL